MNVVKTLAPAVLRKRILMGRLLVAQTQPLIAVSFALPEFLHPTGSQWQVRLKPVRPHPLCLISLVDEEET